MNYINPDIESSYRKNSLGNTLYNIVLEKKPKKIIEIGTLHGYSAVAMAMALDELGGGQLFIYDLFEDYKFNHGTADEVAMNLKKYGVDKYVTIIKKGFEDWVRNPEPFDMLHLDISNKGDTIEQLYNAVKDQIKKGATVIFEGGSKERDEIEWMKRHEYKKISECAVPYKVINKNFPSISLMLP